MKKRIIYCAAVMMVIVMMTGIVSAAQSGTCGKNLTWTLTDDGTLTIKGQGDMYNWSDFSAVPWIGITPVKKVVIDDTVTSIGKYAFGSWSNLTQITLPSGLKTIGDNAFFGNAHLTAITIPDSVTSIGRCAFFGCDGLTEITVPKNVKSIGTQAFSPCRGLMNIYVAADNAYFCSVDGVLCSKNRKTLLVVPAGRKGAFTIPNGVREINQSAFNGCSGITQITVSPGVYDLGYNAFNECSALLNLTVDTENPDLCSVDGVVYSKDRKTLLSVPAGRTGTFTVPDGVTTISEHAFENCTGLNGVVIPDSVISVSLGVFDGCTGLKTAGPIGGDYDYQFGWTSAIPSSAFDGCSGLTSITIPNTVTRIGWGAFDHCTALKDIYYQGSEEEYALMEKGDACIPSDAIVHFVGTIPSVKVALCATECAVAVTPQNLPSGSVLCAAAYKDGRMIGFDHVISAQKEETFTYDSAADTLKVFSFASFDSFVPLTEVTSVAL